MELRVLLLLFLSGAVPYGKTQDDSAGPPGSLEKPKECDAGWLNAKELKQWLYKVKIIRANDTNECTSNVDTQKGWFVWGHLFKTGKTGTLNETTKEKVTGEDVVTELKVHRDFYEDNLWMFKGAANLESGFCGMAVRRDPETKATVRERRVCGMDRKCVGCKDDPNITPELAALCEFQVQPENFVKTCIS